MVNGGSRILSLWENNWIAGRLGIGEKTGAKLSYEGCPVHRVVRGFVIQSGDFSQGNGKGGESIFGGTFEDEDFKIRHNRKGILSMANRYAQRLPSNSLSRTVFVLLVALALCPVDR